MIGALARPCSPSHLQQLLICLSYSDVRRWPPQFFAQLAHGRPILNEVRAWIRQHAPPISTFMPDRLPDPDTNVVNLTTFRSLSRMLFENQIVRASPESASGCIAHPFISITLGRHCWLGYRYFPRRWNNYYSRRTFQCPTGRRVILLTIPRHNHYSLKHSFVTTHHNAFSAPHSLYTAYATDVEHDHTDFPTLRSVRVRISPDPVPDFIPTIPPRRLAEPDRAAH